jgi:hypothetical protein
VRLRPRERVDSGLEEEAHERRALGSRHPLPDRGERGRRGRAGRGLELGEELRLAPPDLGEDLVDEPLLALEVVEQHPRARAESCRERAQAEPVEPVLEDVVGRCRERPRAPLRIRWTCRCVPPRVSDTVVS